MVSFTKAPPRFVPPSTLISGTAWVGLHSRISIVESVDLDEEVLESLPCKGESRGGDGVKDILMIEPGGADVSVRIVED